LSVRFIAKSEVRASRKSADREHYNEDSKRALHII
jgi:hypothetical protein